MSPRELTGQEAPDDPELSFRVRGERVGWGGNRWQMAVVTMEGPDGVPHERDVLRHPGAVGVLPLHDDDTVTLVYQYRAALGRGLWEIPAGLRDVEGEPPEVTAERELIEEAGLAAGRLSHLVSFHNSPGHSDELVVVYLATGLTEVASDRQGVEEENMVVERFPLAHALDRVRSGRITDAKTVIGLLRVAADREM